MQATHGDLVSPQDFSATAGMFTDSVEIDSTPSLLVQNLAVAISASQGKYYWNSNKCESWFNNLK